MSTLQIYENNKHLNMQTQSLVCHNARQISHEGQGAIEGMRLMGASDNDIVTKIVETFNVTKEYVMALLAPKRV